MSDLTYIEIHLGRLQLRPKKESSKIRWFGDVVSIKGEILKDLIAYGIVPCCKVGNIYQRISITELPNEIILKL